MIDQTEKLSKLKSKALSLLSRREHSIYELSEKLSRSLDKKDEDEDEDQDLITPVIEYMTELGYLDEQRYVDMVMRSRVAKGYGATRIRQELQLKRVDSEIISMCFEETSVDWFELAKEVRERRFGGDVVSDPKLKAKQQRYLYSRGFNSDQIHYAMDALSADDY